MARLPAGGEAAREAEAEAEVVLVVVGEGAAPEEAGEVVEAVKGVAAVMETVGLEEVVS